MPAAQTTPQGQLYTEETIKALIAQPGIDIATNVDGATVPEFGIWRPHTIFNNADGERFSADQLLDRQNQNLVVVTEKEVDRIIFEQKGMRYRAKCVRFTDGSEDGSDDPCIKKNGRVFLAAGAFHTPELLMKSGIGEGGVIYNNPQVRKQILSVRRYVFFSFPLLQYVIR